MSNGVLNGGAKRTDLRFCSSPLPIHGQISQGSRTGTSWVHLLGFLVIQHVLREFRGRCQGYALGWSVGYCHRSDPYEEYEK